MLRPVQAQYVTANFAATQVTFTVRQPYLHRAGESEIDLINETTQGHFIMRHIEFVYRCDSRIEQE